MYKLARVSGLFAGPCALSRFSHVRLFATLWTVAPPGSSVHGILQARILEWVAISFSRDLPDPGIELRSPALQPDPLLSEPPGKPFFFLPNYSHLEGT